MRWILLSFIIGCLCGCMHNQTIKVAVDIPPSRDLTTRVEYMGEF